MGSRGHFLNFCSSSLSLAVCGPAPVVQVPWDKPSERGVTKCCTESLVNRRPRFSALQPDESYVPKEFNAESFTFHADICTLPDKEKQFKKQLWGLFHYHVFVDCRCQLKWTNISDILVIFFREKHISIATIKMRKVLRIKWMTFFLSRRKT